MVWCASIDCAASIVWSAAESESDAMTTPAWKSAEDLKWASYSLMVQSVAYLLVWTQMFQPLVQWEILCPLRCRRRCCQYALVRLISQTISWYSRSWLHCGVCRLLKEV